MTRRVVITGMGVVTPLSNDVKSYWAALLAGKSGVGPIELIKVDQYKVRFGGEVKGFDANQHMDRKMVRRMTRFIHFAVAAANEAIADAGLDFSSWTQEQRDRVAVVVNTGGGVGPGSRGKTRRR